MASAPRARRRLPRAERREQILDAATRAFARHGFADTGLDEIAAQSGVTRVLLYRHFDSKADLYRAVIERSIGRLAGQVGTDDYQDDSIAALLAAASDDPDGFRLLFRFANRERECSDLTDSLTEASVDIARRNLARHLGDGPWLDWASRLVPTVTIEAVIGWLDAGRPDPQEAAERIRGVINGITDAARGKDQEAER